MLFVARLDTTLVDFSDMKWERGDMSVLFDGESKPGESLVVLDNLKRVYQNIKNKVGPSQYLRLLTLVTLPCEISILRCVITWCLWLSGK